ncbi:MAG: NAD(P)/FAD-dependent oxidoreductase [Alphaproteobacteria bacterium]
MKSPEATGDGRPVEQRDIVVVGGGPAGAATALWLERLDPDLARGCLVLDGAAFPRDKTCAGGLIPHTLELLADLGLGLDVAHVRVDRARVETGGAPVSVAQRGVCWVIRRREFDAMLLDAVRDRGIEVRCGSKVTSVRREGDRFRVDTSDGAILARAVVGADGSGSLVRRSLVDSGEGWVARASMADVPTGRDEPDDLFEFDFRSIRDGLAGYEWSFPCLVDGRPHWNVGVYSLRRDGEGGRIARLLDRRAGAPGTRHRAAPIRLYDGRSPIAAPGVLLVGDAAGAEALLGEGISFALEYGRLAAEELVSGFASGDLSFAGWTAAVRRSPTGRKLARLAMFARLFYGPTSPIWFFLMRLSGRVQAIGLNWYNGVGGTETVSARLDPGAAGRPSARR